MQTYQDFHRRSIEDRDGFWRDEARLVDWHAPFTQVLDYSRPPFARWFVGGRTNLCHNAVDRHLAPGERFVHGDEAQPVLQQRQAVPHGEREDQRRRLPA